MKDANGQQVREEEVSLLIANFIIGGNQTNCKEEREREREREFKLANLQRVREQEVA